MPNINTSGALSNRDLSLRTPPTQPDSFRDLYDEIISKLSILSQIEDTHLFKIELNKLRKKIHILISKHFDQSVNHLSQHYQYREIVSAHKEQLTKIQAALCN